MARFPPSSRVFTLPASTVNSTAPDAPRNACAPAAAVARAEGAERLGAHRHPEQRPQVLAGGRERPVGREPAGVLLQGSRQPPVHPEHLIGGVAAVGPAAALPVAAADGDGVDAAQ
jgi:hypothetical protein